MDNKISDIEIENIAENHFSIFSEKIGSEQIIRKSGLRFLGRLLRDENIKSILEIGTGIGTIASFIQGLPLNKKFKIIGYEIDGWCLEQLKLMPAQIPLLTSSEELHKFNGQVDLIIFDDYIDFAATKNLIANTNPKFIFIEGHRRIQRLFVILSSMQIKQNLYFKNYPRTSDSAKTGCLFILNGSKKNKIYALNFVVGSLFYSKIIEIRSRIHLKSFLNRFR